MVTGQIDACDKLMFVKWIEHLEEKAQQLSKDELREYIEHNRYDIWLRANSIHMTPMSLEQIAEWLGPDIL